MTDIVLIRKGRCEERARAPLCRGVRGSISVRPYIVAGDGYRSVQSLRRACVSSAGWNLKRCAGANTTTPRARHLNAKLGQAKEEEQQRLCHRGEGRQSDREKASSPQGCRIRRSGRHQLPSVTFQCPKVGGAKPISRVRQDPVSKSVVRSSAKKKFKQMNTHMHRKTHATFAAMFAQVRWGNHCFKDSVSGSSSGSLQKKRWLGRVGTRTARLSSGSWRGTLGVSGPAPGVAEADAPAPRRQFRGAARQARSVVAARILQLLQVAAAHQNHHASALQRKGSAGVVGRCREAPPKALAHSTQYIVHST